MNKKKIMAMGFVMAMVLTTTGCGIDAMFSPFNTTVADKATAELPKTDTANSTVEMPEIRDLGEMLAEAGLGELESEGPKGTSGYVEGVITDNTYESGYVGLKFTAPEGYYVAVEEMALMNAFMSLGDGSGGMTEFMNTPIPEGTLDGDTVIRFELIAMEEGGTGGSVMIQSLQTENTSVFKDILDQTDGEKVSKWGKEWMCVHETEGVNGEQISSDIYCLEMPGVFYIVTVVSADGSEEGMEMLLNAFEQAEITVGADTTDTE